MRIRTLWAPSEADDEMPWLVNAVDEYTIDGLGGDLPDTYREDLQKDKARRELIINIPEKAVIDLFAVPVVNGKVEP